MNSSPIIKDLNNLLEYLYDSRNGFRECAGQVADVQLKNLFTELAAQRENLIASLASAIQSLGGSAVEEGSVTAAFHRVFVDLKSLLTNGDRIAITNEVKRGENTLRDRYQVILRQTMPAAIHDLLTQQLTIIDTSLSQIEHTAESK